MAEPAVNGVSDDNGLSDDKSSSSEAEWGVGEHATVHGHVFDENASLELFSICDDKIALSWLLWKDDEEEE